MKLLTFKHYCIQKSFFKRFVLPMISWSKFFEVGFYDKEKFIIKHGHLYIFNQGKDIRVELEKDQNTENINVKIDDIKEVKFSKVNQIYDNIIHEFSISLILKKTVKSFTVLDPTSTVEVIATLQALLNLRVEQRSDNTLLKDEIKSISKALTNKI